MAVVLLGFVFATCPDEPLSFRPNSTDVKLSGSGRMWEYYHFLVDFAAPIASHMARAPAPEHCPKRLLLPMRDVFYLTNRWNNGRSMQAHFDALFAGLNLELVHVGEARRGVAATEDEHAEALRPAGRPAACAAAQYGQHGGHVSRPRGGRRAWFGFGFG